MPEARRRAIAEALLRIVSRSGLDEVSLRAVAAEARTSLGMVQRQFRDKDELLLFALRLSGEATAERIARIPLRSPVLGTLRRVVDELLPLDERRVTEARVYHAFAAKAATRPDFATVLAEHDANFQWILASAFATAEAEGEIPPGRDHRALARMFIAVVDGTSLALLARPSAAAELTTGVDTTVDLIAGRAP